MGRGSHSDASLASAPFCTVICYVDRSFPFVFGDAFLYLLVSHRNHPVREASRISLANTVLTSLCLPHLETPLSLESNTHAEKDPLFSPCYLSRAAHRTQVWEYVCIASCIFSRQLLWRISLSCALWAHSLLWYKGKRTGYRVRRASASYNRGWGWGGWEHTRGGVAEGGFAQAFRSSKGENYFFAQELIPLFSHTARKFFSRSAPNLSSCG